MSEIEHEAEGFGAYYPEAAGHQPYNDAMAAWRNEVRAMQAAGTLPPTQEPQEEPESPETVETPQEGSAGAQEGSESQQEQAEWRDETPVGATHEYPEGTVDDGDGRTDQSDGQEPGTDEEPAEVFDPAEHTVADTLEYLKGVGEDEAKRVLESEEAGKRRLGLLNAKDEILAKARENDEN